MEHMNSLIFLSAFLLGPLSDSIPVNPRYDFPEQLVGQIKQHHTGRRDQVNKIMDVLSIAGYYRESLRYEDSLKGPKAPVRLTLSHKRVVDAKATILQAAKKHRILLINEAHNHPEHRLFTKSLLKELYAQGYNVFMAEGISSVTNTLGAKKYPVGTDGYYISEPNYASLLRYAMSNGYKVRAYEYASKGYWDDSVKLDEYGSTKYISYEPRDSFTIKFDGKGDTTYIMTGRREKGQADNIFKVMQENPRSKFIIHVGHGHLQEGGAMMAARLRELINYEDILTVSQEELDDRATLTDTLTGDNFTRDFAYLLWDSTRNRPYHFYNGLFVDYTIFNAKVKDSLGRPGFLFKDVQQRIVYQLPAAQQEGCPCLFSAYPRQEYQKEGANTVAVDNVYMKDEQRPPLLLYKGDYTIIKKDGAGEYSRFDIGVK